MNQKKDVKGRNLKQGEDQLKDGRYRYRYTDQYGNRKIVYAWKLVKTDKTPSGKKEDLCLREKERNIEKDVEDQIRTYDAQNMTVYELILKYLDTKSSLANATIENYKHMTEKNIKESLFGKSKLCDIKKSDIKKFYSYLYKEKNFKTGTIQLYQNLLFPAFQLAVDDSIIRLNPCKGCMKDYVRGSMSSTKKPLEIEEQKALLKFVKGDNTYSKYYTMVAFMLSTGCRIGETIGLTWDNIDFKNKCVYINHQVIYKKKDGRNQFYVEPPKNRTNRTIPLQQDILNVLGKYKKETFIVNASFDYKLENLTNFVFMNTWHRIYTPYVIVRAFHGIRDSYNSIRDKEDVELPDFSPHTLRHTACTRFAENGMDVKVLQEIMGHKTIMVTMQVYNHVNSKRAEQEMEKMPSMLEM